jgi:hypothetical protein
MRARFDVVRPLSRALPPSLPLPLPPSLPLPLALALALALALPPPIALAQRVIPPGHEAEIRAMLDAPIDGCALVEASIVRDRIEAAFRCPEGMRRLVLRDAQSADAALPRASDLAAELDRWPEPDRSILLAHLRGRAPADLWTSRAASDAARTRTIAPELAFQLAVLAIAIALGAAGVGAWRPTVPRHTPRGSGLDPLAVGALISFVATLALGAATFRFAFDDFTYLLYARSDPWRFDPELRLIGIRIPFALAHRLAGGHAPFVVMNLAACAALGLALHALLGRAELPRGLALAGAALGAGSSYVVPLLRWGVGIQHLFALTAIITAILALDVAARAEGRRRAGAVLVAIALGLATVLSKWQLAVLIPSSSFVWCAYVTRSSRAVATHALVAIVLAIPIALRFVLFAPSTEPPIASPTSPLGSIAALVTRTGPTLCLAGALLVAEVIRRARGEPRPAPAARSGPFVALAAVGIAPFLANTVYFADYYPALAHTWIAVAILIAIDARTTTSPARRGLVGGVIAAVALPWIPLHALSPPPPRDRAEAFVSGAAAVLAGRGAPEAIHVRAACPDRAPALATMIDAAGGADGFRWALHAPDLRLVDDPSALTLSWCPAETPAWRVTPDVTTR